MHYLEVYGIVLKINKSIVHFQKGYSFIIFILFNFNLSFSALAQLQNLSQTTNLFVSQDSYHLIWISSANGVNIYDGKDVKVFNSANSNLKGENIQSYFYEDCNTNMWFCTYSALHVYDRHLDALRYFQFTDETNKVIEREYRVFGNFENFVLGYADTTLFLFDINTEQVVQMYSLPNIKADLVEPLFLELSVHLFTVVDKKLTEISIPYFQKADIIESKVVWDQNVQDLDIVDNEDLIVVDGEGNHILKYSLSAKAIDTIYSTDRKINGIAVYKKELVFEDGENLAILDLDHHRIKAKFPLKKEGLITQTFFLNDLIGYGIDGKGLEFHSPSKKKFDILDVRPDAQFSNPNGLLQDVEGNLWSCSRAQGFCRFDKKGVLLDQYGGRGSFFGYDMILDQDGFPLIIGKDTIYRFDQMKNEFIPFKMDLPFEDVFLAFITRLRNGRILISDVNNANSIYELKLSPHIHLKPLAISSESKYQFQNIFEVDDSTMLFVTDVNHLSFFRLKGDSLRFQKRFDLGVFIRSILKDENSNNYFICTESGIFRGTIEDGFRRLYDTSQLLSRYIFDGILYNQYLYLSTNFGIVRYNTIDNTAHQFSIADGLQGKEYNTNATLVDDEGYFYLGGTRGINKFHPDSISLRENEAPIHISKIEVNGKDYDFGMNVSQISYFTNSYKNNTLTFYFHGIDYADPLGVDLKYKLEGKDRDWQLRHNNAGVAPYTKLEAGSYSFQILASNSDGHWNDTIRSIDFVIKPPYWQTWWFRITVSLLIIGLFYHIIKSYYDRKLEKKNALLREKELIIQSQIALENERTRIATDMHDDLGSGLTMIKYLSDIASRQVENQKTKDLIVKITAYSNTLVQNMSEIIWAMNTRFDNSLHLVAYIRRYVSVLLEDHNVPLRFQDRTNDDSFVINGIKRRSIFLALKEALNNSIKHSNSSAIEFTIFKERNSLRIDLHEIGGIGFDFDESVEKGNGLFNIKKRMKVFGSISFRYTDQGFLISFMITE